MKLAQQAKKLFSRRHWLTICLCSITAATLCWSIWIAFAATRTWTGGTPGDPTCPAPNAAWINQCNWSGKMLPVPGDDLVFPASLQPASSNNFANGTTFNSISISGGHVMLGNSVSLNAGITANSGQISLSSIKLNANQTFTAPTGGSGAAITSTIDTNAKTLTVDGPGNFTMVGVIGGSGGLVKNGSGTLTLAGANAYSGTTTVNDGTLLVFGSQPQSSVVLDPSIGAAILGGSGTVGQITFGNVGNGTGVISPGGENNAAGILTENGNLSFPAARPAGLVVDLNSATVGTGYDQLKINGSVSINSPTINFLTVRLGFTPASGTTFTIIDNDGADPISGTFAVLAEGSPYTINNTTLFITYKGGDGNDVVLRVPETKTWSGAGGDSNWTTGANWQGGSAPQPGDNLVFPSGVTSFTPVNNFPSGASFNSITFSGGGYSLTGNGIDLTSGVTQTATSGFFNGVSVSVPIKLRVNQSFSVPGVSGPRLTFHGGIDTNGRTLTVGGDGACNFDSQSITGTGGLIRSGLGETELAAANTYSGSTTVNSGFLSINGNQPASAVTLNGGSLSVAGTTGPITTAGGTLIVGYVPGSLTVNGNLTLNSAASFQIGKHGSGLNRQFGSLNVSGAVSLANATLIVDPIPPLPTTRTFIIINNTGSGAVSGIFNGLPEGSYLTSIDQQFFVSYHGGDGNDVTLHMSETRTWSGGGSTDQWSEGANWIGGVAPAPGDDLVFPANALRKMTNNNDLASGTTFNSISFTGPGYNLNGNGIRLLNGMVNSAFTNNVFSLGSILLGFDQTFSALEAVLVISSPLDTNGRTLTLDGSGTALFSRVISGSGNLVINGPLQVDTSFNANLHTLSGPIIINSGTLYPGRLPNSPIQLNNGQLFAFSNSSANSVTANSGTISQASTGLMTINGNLSLNSNVTYRPQFLNSIGRLEVGGAVNLANSTLEVDAALFTSPPAGNSFTMINKTSAGAIQGTFKDLPEGATLLIKGFPFQISYTGGNGNDVVLTKAPPILLTEEGSSSRVAALDSVTFVRGPFTILNDHNFSRDHLTRVILFTSNLELTQPDPAVLTVSLAGINLEVENVGNLTRATNGFDGSYIVVKLPNSLTPGNHQISFTLRSITSNAGVLTISP